MCGENDLYLIDKFHRIFCHSLLGLNPVDEISIHKHRIVLKSARRNDETEI
jgi:hypothetical protein